MIDGDEFPTDLSDDSDDGASALAWTSAVIALTALGLGLFNAGALSDWAGDLSPGPTSAKVMAATDAWEETTASVGFDAPHARLHRLWKSGEMASWNGRHEVEMAQR